MSFVVISSERWLVHMVGGGNKNLNIGFRIVLENAMEYDKILASIVRLRQNYVHTRPQSVMHHMDLIDLRMTSGIYMAM